MDTTKSMDAAAGSQQNYESWPGGFAIVKRSFVDFFTNIAPWLVGLLAFVPILVVILLQLSALSAGVSSASINIISVFAGLIGAVAILYVALCWVASVPLYGLARADGRAMTIKEVYTVRWRQIGRLIGATILLMIPIIIGFILLIIPGIIILILLIPTFVLVPFVIVEENLTIMESIKSARAIAKGHAGKVWGLIGVYFLIGLIIALPFIILFMALDSNTASAVTNVNRSQSGGASNTGGGGGGFAGSPLSSISYAYLYRWIKKQNSNNEPQAASISSAAPVAPQVP